MRFPIAVAALGVLLAATLTGRAQEPWKFSAPAGIPLPKVPVDNPITAAKVELGKQLYFDARLSKDDTISCASCHDPAKGWSNGEKFATGIGGQKGGRSAPTIMNAAFFPMQFWDGRAANLEGQALGPIQNPIEMGMTLDAVVSKLNKVEGYRKQFRDVFGTEVTSDGIAKAIASFERTILSGDAPYDRWVAGDKKALSEAADRGRVLFFGKAHCSACHAGPNFTDTGFHNIGVGIKGEKPDWGRFEHSKQDGDKGSFKTPPLRDIARTAPYMHDGSLATLEEVVDYYDKGGEASEWLDEEMAPLKLTAAEKADLVSFLKEGLSATKYPEIKAPKLPE